MYYHGKHSEYGLEGEGTVTTAENIIFQEGHFVHNLLHGEGREYYLHHIIAEEFAREGKPIPETPIIHLEGLFVNGVLEGKGCEYTIDGQLLYEGMFVAGDYEGEGTLYDYTREIKMQGQFVAGRLHGQGGVFTLQGKCYEQGEYMNGVLHGKGIEYYPNGQVEYEGDFIEGERRGLGCCYNEQGQLIYQGDLFGDCWTGHGICYDYERGFIFEGSMADNFLTGKGCIRLITNGMIVQEGIFEQNILVNGREYDSMTGVITREGQLDQTTNTFVGKIYDEHGLLKMETTIINNFPHGPTTLYYPTNPPIKQKEGRMNRGLFEGEVLGYRKDGSLYYKTTYVKGIEHGARQEYIDGICLFQGVMEGGQKKGPAMEYDIYGRVQFKGDYYNGKPWNGVETRYMTVGMEHNCYYRTWKEGQASSTLVIYGKESAEVCSLDKSWRCVYHGGWVDDCLDLDDDLNNLNGNLNGNDDDWKSEQSLLPLRHGDGIFYLEDGQQISLKWEYDLPITTQCIVRRLKVEGTKWKQSMYKGEIVFDAIRSLLHPEFYLHGNGYFYFQDNSFFVGQWQDGKLVNAQNVIYWSDNTVKYQTKIAQMPATGQYAHEYLPSGPTRFFPKTWRGIVEGTFAADFNCLNNPIILYSLDNKMIAGPHNAQYSMNPDGYNVDYGYPLY